MNRNIIATISLVSSLAPSLSPASQATEFHSRQILVAGDDNVDATAINNNGTIVATLFAGITDTPSGIAINGNTITTLPLPEPSYGALNPRAINDAGDILGWARGSLQGLAQTFLLKAGAYDTAYQSPVIEPGQNAQYLNPDPMGLTKTDKIFFNTIYSLSGPIGTNYGKPPNYHHVPAMNRFTVLQSINAAGTVAGTSFSFSGMRTMFVGMGKNFVNIAPPGSVSTLGGYLNNKGAVAGSYVDANHAYHGFLYQSGAYATFDMPQAAATITVTAVNNSGRIAGTYASSTNGKVHAFLYNGATVSAFGTFDATDTVSVALNDRGAMVVVRQIASEKPKYESYSVSCAGSGC